ncbi:MAG: 1,4-dihydroxy-6-naphthoate synthase [Parachlamydiales bacterium]
MRVAFSPCPNDTFLFAHYIAETGVEPTIADIQELNELALTHEYDLIKVSCALLPLPPYRVLPVGAAIGYGCGPLLISRSPFPLTDLPTKRVAIPGKSTTAHLLLDRVAPAPRAKHFLPYHEILEAVEQGAVDAGVIIHEQRFTYQERGLHLIADLGALWNGPVPLGCLLAKPQLAATLTEALQRSLEAAYKKPPLAYMQTHAQELSPAVIQKHVDLYVAEETRQLSPAGVQAISRLIKKPSQEWLWS